MKKLTIVALAAALFVCAPVFAQTKSLGAVPTQTLTWNSLTKTAIKEPDLVKKLALLHTAVGLAETGNEKFRANMNISEVLFQQRNYREAEKFVRKALVIADDKLPNNSKLRTEAIAQIYKVLRKLGLEQEGLELLQEDVRRKSAKSDHIWKASDNGPVHRFTDFTCPDFISQMARKKKTSYNNAGIDVGCGYDLISDKYNDVTVYFARAGAVSDEQAIIDADNAMIQKYPNAQTITYRKQAAFTTGNLRPVYFTLLTLGTPQSGESYTGAWSQVIGMWELSGRMTWDSHFGVDFGAEKIEAVFTQTAKNVAEHFRACEALDLPKSGVAKPRNAALLNVLFGEILGGLGNNLVKDIGNLKPIDGTVGLVASPLKNIPPEPDITCFVTKSSGDELALGYHPDANQRYSTYSSVFQDKYYVEKQVQIAGLAADQPPYYALKTIKDRVKTIYQVYDGEPDPDTIFGDIIKVINGTLGMIGSVKFDKEGNSTVTISPDITSEVEEEK